MPKVNYNDAVNFLSKLTARRLWNAIKVYSSYYITLFFKKPVQWGLPVSISFEPTTSCNLRCPECPSGLRQFTRARGMLKNDFFTKTIDEIYKTVKTAFYRFFCYFICQKMPVGRGGGVQTFSRRIRNHFQEILI